MLTGVTPDMDVAREETFGPVAPLFRFDTEADAISLANARSSASRPIFLRPRHRPCLAGRECAGIRDHRRQHRPDLHRGCPFGGMKESGIGREGSKRRLEEFLEVNIAVHGRAFDPAIR